MIRGPGRLVCVVDGAGAAVVVDGGLDVVVDSVVDVVAGAVVDVVVDVPVVDEPVVVVSPGSPMSVVESLTLVVKVGVEVVDVVAMWCGRPGSGVAGGTKVCDSGLSHCADIRITAMTRPATTTRPAIPAATVAAADRYHGVSARAMSADPR